jgi:hypothetical protein
MTFSLESSAILHFDLRYDFVSSGLTLALAASVQEEESVVNTTIYALYGENHAFFHRVLLPGTYTIQIRDAFPSRLNSTIVCGFYSVEYILNTTDVPVVCDDTEQLPEDLTSPDSIPYGGPQAEDGSVRIWGDKFALVNTDGPKDRFIEFVVPVDAYMRAFVSSLDDNDIDFFLYNNVNRTFGSLIDSSFGTTNVESGLFYLENQTSPYLLDVFFFDVVSDPDTCPTFHFELAIKPITTLQAELVCPNPLPQPEVPDPNIYVTEEIWIDDEFIFTSDRIAGNTDFWGQFVYRMTITATSNITIFSSIGFDFLANDYNLLISDAVNGQEVYANGYYDGTDDRSDYINFENYLFVELPAGVYWFDITEKDADLKDFEMEEYCHRFELFLAIFPSE